MKRNLWIAAALLLVACLAFAGGQGEAGKSGGGKLYAVMGTSGIGGSWYPTASKVAGVAMSASDIQIVVQASGGGTENIRLMKQGQYQLGMSESNVMAYGYKGVDLFKGDAYPNMRFVTNLYPIVFQAAVMKDTPYKSIRDLKGKSFSPGSAGSGDEAGWAEIFSIFGLTKNDVQWRPLTHTERAMAFKDRQLDSIGYETSVPAGTLLEAYAQNQIRLLPIGGEDQKNLFAKFAWYTPWTIPAKTYNGQDEAVETVATGSAIIADAGLSEEFVYKMLKAMYGNLEPIQATHAMTKYISLKTALDGRGDVPLHPGAEKFFREQGMVK